MGEVFAVVTAGYRQEPMAIFTDPHDAQDFADDLNCEDNESLLRPCFIVMRLPLNPESILDMDMFYEESEA